MPLKSAKLAMLQKMPPEMVMSPSGTLMLALVAESPVVFAVLSTVNARSEVTFIGPDESSMATLQVPMIDASIGSGVVVLTPTLVSRCRRLGAVGVRLSVWKSNESVHTIFGVVQQISLPVQVGGTLKVLPPMRPGISEAPLADTYWNSDWVARIWIAFSCRLSTGNPPLIGCTHEQPLLEQAASPMSTTVATAL